MKWLYCDVKDLNENESDLGIRVAYTFEYDTCRSRDTSGYGRKRFSGVLLNYPWNYSLDFPHFFISISTLRGGLLFPLE